jgi:hypothetical protein
MMPTIRGAGARGAGSTQREGCRPGVAAIYIADISDFRRGSAAGENSPGFGKSLDRLGERGGDFGDGNAECRLENQLKISTPLKSLSWGSSRVIPLFHLPAECAVSPALNDWRPAADASWRLDEVWLGKDKP